MKHKIQYGNSTIDFTLDYSERKTLGVKVYPDKTVEVIAPINTQLEKVLEKVKSKASWILKQQDFFLSFHPLTPNRKYVSGETHLYLGKRYRLKLIESSSTKVKLQKGYIEIYVSDKNDKTKIKSLLNNWYKEKAIIHFENLFKHRVTLAKEFYKSAPSLKSRWMDKRWGSCSQSGTITLNIELIKAPKVCIDYVIVHEICHLAHLNHSKAFYNLLENKLPNWKTSKNYLERLMV